MTKRGADEWMAEVRAWAAGFPQREYVDFGLRPGRDDDERGTELQQETMMCDTQPACDHTWAYANRTWAIDGKHVCVYRQCEDCGRRELGEATHFTEAKGQYADLPDLRNGSAIMLGEIVMVAVDTTAGDERDGR